ncbi:PilZ domain-containing protein [Paenibacillus elgii]|uniref:PilZ domain-containing protein n=1 Tax=Paenibacillus elgii TaxID=189691 RepID=A0A2T6FRM8_9BACL|nr:PilZ domain-containing protein [Paenibacillus elgii]PUA34563.1 PilZ domain-containing protein [Paenibacillus elgii]
MNTPAVSRKHLDNSKERHRGSGTVMLNSRIVVEKEKFVSTGVLTFVEGDILEIEMSEYKAFELGDAVKLTIYSPGGFYPFESTVVAKDQGVVMVLIPPQHQNRFAEKREHPRVQVNQKGALVSYRNEDGSWQVPEGQIPLTVKNISLSGIGFIIEEPVELDRDALVQLHLDLGFSMHCRAEIIRTEPVEFGCYYGAHFDEMAADKANSLRAFILKKQVESHFAQKREE